MLSPRWTSTSIGAQEVIASVVPPPEEGSFGLSSETTKETQGQQREALHRFSRSHTSYQLYYAGEHSGRVIVSSSRDCSTAVEMLEMSASSHCSSRSSAPKGGA